MMSRFRLAFCIAITSLSIHAPVAASNFSSKPIRLLVPYSAGGPSDSVAREIAQAMGKELGTTVIVENQGGALGAIALNNVVRAEADGHTLFFPASGNITVNPLVSNAVATSVDKLTPIGIVTTQPHVLVVSSKIPVRSIGEFIDYAKANPGKINFGSSGAGGLSHLSQEQFAQMADIDVVHIPYKGTSQAVTDLVSGNIQAFFTSMPSLNGLLDDGAIRVIGATAASGSSALKGVPIIGDVNLPGFGYTTWYAVYGPAGMSDDTVSKINAALVASTNDPAIKAKLNPLGIDLAHSTPDQLRKMGESERTNWQKVIRDANLQF